MENRNEHDQVQATVIDKVLIRCKSAIYTISKIIQYLVAITIIVAILITLLKLPVRLSLVAGTESRALIHYLEYVVNIIIALELVHVLCHQTIDSIVEILSLAITRELILQSPQAHEILIGVAAIALLFVIRKYLFISKLDDDDDEDRNDFMQHISSYKKRTSEEDEESGKSENVSSR